MNISESIIASLFYSILFISCSNDAKHSAPNSHTGEIKFTLVDSVQLKTPADLPLTEMKHIQSDEKGNYYLLDSRLNKIMAFDSRGNMLWESGQEGKGPGDIYQPWDFMYHDGRLLISNQTGMQLDYFNMDGEYLKSYLFGNGIRLISFLGINPSGQLVGNTPNWDGWGHEVYTFSITGDSLSRVHHFLLDQSDGVEVPYRMNGSISLNLIDDHIYSGSLTDYSFRVFTLNGEPVDTIKQNKNVIVRPGMATDGNSRSMKLFGGVEAPLKVGNNLVMSIALWPVNIKNPDQWVLDKLKDRKVPGPEYRNSLDFYNAEGELLSSLESEGMHPEIGEISHVDKSGLFYVTGNNPTPVIYRYRLNGPDL